MVVQQIRQDDGLESIPQQCRLLDVQAQVSHRCRFRDRVGHSDRGTRQPLVEDLETFRSRFRMVGTIPEYQTPESKDQYGGLRHGQLVMYLRVHATQYECRRDVQSLPLFGQG